MKKLVLMAAVLLCAGWAHAQVTVNEKDISTLSSQYCKVFLVEKGISGTKYRLYMDYGQPETGMEDKEVMVDGARGIFSGEMAALNFMARQGWEYVDSYVEGHPSGVNVHCFLLRRKPS